MVFSLLLSIVLPTVALAQTDENADDVGSHKVTVYSNGKASYSLDVDSITVAELYGPIIPGRTVALTAGNRNTSRSSRLYINGLRQNLTVPNTDENFSPAYVAKYGNDLYTVGEYAYNKGNSWIQNQKYAVWKNGEYQYTIADDSWNYPSLFGIHADADGLYLYGGLGGDTESTASEITNAFYVKNNETPVKVKSIDPRDFDIENGEVYIGSVIRRKSSFHSMSTWTDYTYVMSVWHNGVLTDLQTADGSKDVWLNDMKVRNGVVHAVGYSQTMKFKYWTSETTWKDTVLWAAVNYNGSQTTENSDYSECLRLAYDSNGNEYTIVRGAQSRYYLLKNGRLQYEIPTDYEYEGMKRRGFSDTGLWYDGDPKIIFAGNDVYVWYQLYYEDSSDHYKFIDYLLRNGQLYWHSDKDHYISDIAIY